MMQVIGHLLPSSASLNALLSVRRQLAALYNRRRHGTYTGSSRPCTALNLKGSILFTRPCAEHVVNCPASACYLQDWCFDGNARDIGQPCPGKQQPCVPSF
jgi:hypothetical protein